MVKTLWVRFLILWHKIRVPLMVGAFIGLFIANFIILDQLEKVNKLESENVQRQSEELQRGINDVNNHLDCILEFYSQANRSNLVIGSIEECRLRRLQSIQEPTAQPSAPRRVVRSQNTFTPTPRTADRSFLDCLPAEARNRLKKLLPKNDPVRKLKC